METYVYTASDILKRIREAVGSKTKPSRATVYKQLKEIRNDPSLANWWQKTGNGPKNPILYTQNVLDTLTSEAYPKYGGTAEKLTLSRLQELDEVQMQTELQRLLKEKIDYTNREDALQKLMSSENTLQRNTETYEMILDRFIAFGDAINRLGEQQRKLFENLNRAFEEQADRIESYAALRVQNELLKQEIEILKSNQK